MYCIFINLRILNINNLFHDFYIKHHRETMLYITFCDVTFLHESKSIFFYIIRYFIYRPDFLIFRMHSKKHWEHIPSRLINA